MNGCRKVKSSERPEEDEKTNRVKGDADLMFSGWHFSAVRSRSRAKRILYIPLNDVPTARNAHTHCTFDAQKCLTKKSIQNLCTRMLYGKCPRPRTATESERGGVEMMQNISCGSRSLSYPRTLGRA